MGTWRLDSDKSTRITLNRDGTFLFAAPSYKSTSSGVYEIRDGSIVLTYREIDGEPVQSASPLRAPLAGDFASFKINRFRYVRADK